MTDYSDTISQYATVPQSQTIGSINDDPDDAADALKLSSDTGVDSSAILGDLDNFKAQHKAVLASDIVANNPQLQDYVRSHPLAAKVSNDDWGVMDAVSSAGGWLDRAHDYMWKHDPLTQAGQEALSEAGEGLAQDPFPTPDTYNPLSRLAWSALGVPLRIGSAIFGGVAGGAEGAATTIGGEQFGRDIRGMVENEMLASGPEGVHGAQYWIENGLAAPPGVSPTIDRIRAAANIEGLNSLSDKLIEAQGSSTRERSPEMFRNFIAQRYGNATIGISGDAVTALYGDKTPAQGDGLLGFSPGMADQLELARQTGADVHVPIADWLTHVDPAVATQLHDDIRVWPNGVTAREAATPIEPNQVIDAPLPQVRDALATEPMFAVGDRKLSLTPIESGSEDFHDYHILDQTGNHVGDLEIIPNPKKKELYVSMINGVAGQYANSFGPSLMLNLKRQLKSIYPDYEWLTGHRVSGARYEAGTWEGDSAYPRVRLATPEAADLNNDYVRTKRLLNDTYWYRLSDSVSANIRPTEEYTAHEQELTTSISDELRRMGGTGFDIYPSDAIYSHRQNINPLGLYHPFPDRPPMILYNLFHPDAVGVARHEGIHLLRRQGLLSPQDWSVLSKAAESEGWLDKYRINERYSDLAVDPKTEEAIAEAYRDWASGSSVPPEVHGIFERLKRLWESIKDRVSQIFGREPTWEELFQQIYEGKFAGEGGGTEAEPAFSIDNRDQVQAQAMGLDLKSYQRLQSAIKARYDADLESATKRAMAEQKREQTKEWKVNKAEVTKTVSDQIRQRPDVAADLFFGSGELFGEKIQQRFSMRSADLTDEQKATLPTRYYSKEGIPVDEAARLFGFTSGDAMVQKLGEYHATKAGLTSQEMLKQTTDAEVDRQMQAKYGSLGDNIMTEARDQALSESDLNLIAEEMQAAGLRAGTPVIDKTVAKDWATEQFGKQTIGDANTDRLMATVGRHGRDTERSLIGGDSASAMVSLQKKYLSALIAADSAKLDKEKTQFAKLAKSMARKEVKSMDPEYLNWVQNILQRVGQRTQRMPWDIKADIEGRSQNTLEDFINDKQGMLRELPVADFLLDPKWNKDFPTLTVDEFRAVHDSLKALVHNGRDEMKIVRAGEARDFGEVKEGLVGQLANTAKLSYDAKGRRWMGPIPPGIASKIRTYVAISTQIENLLNRFDHFDPHGLWNQYVMRDLIDGSNTKDSLVKKYASRLAEADDGVDLKRTVDNPLFRDPIGGGKLEFTRANLRAIMLNTGNASNLDKLERGYNLTSGSVRAWVDQHATKEDWDWTQKIWDVFADIKKESDTMYRSLTGGVAPGSVKITPVQTQFGDYAGGYYPVIYHPKFEGTSKKLLGGNPLEQQNYVRATTPSGHTKERTGYAAPMALDIDPLPNRIQQMLHDIALRPAVINASKVFYDKDIRTAIAAHYGTEYRDLLIPYVRDVANVSNYISSSQAELDSLGGFFRQNLVTSLVGLNIGTVAKHAPTALVTSINEVGAGNFLKAVRGMFSVNPDTGESNYQFAMKNSLELQRRDLNFSESLYGAAGQISSPGGFRSMQQFIRENASKPIAFSDKLSAVPTWLAQYNKSMSESGVHGDAIYDADRAVRRAHGSTAITNRPAIVRVTSPWLTTFYNFFSDILNRQMETVWKAGEAVDLAKSGQFQAAMGHVPEIAAGLFAYAIWPAVVEQLVSPTGGKNQSWTSKAAEALGSTLSSSWVGVRDLVNAMMAGRDPTLGLGGTALGYAAQTYKDLHDKYPSKQKNERIIIHAAQLGGLMTGMVPAPVGRLTAFGYGTNVGIEHPKGPWSWLVGARYGTLKNHSSTLENYLAGKPW